MLGNPTLSIHATGEAVCVQQDSDLLADRFFGGRLVIDGAEIDTSLFKMVKDTMEKTNGHIDKGLVLL